MDAYIRFQKNINDEDSLNLTQLAELIADQCDLSVEITKRVEPGKKGGLAIGLAIASLALAAIQTFISVLQFWQSKQPKYSVSITFDNSITKRTFAIKESSLKDIQAVVSQLQADSSINCIEVQISKEN